MGNRETISVFLLYIDFIIKISRICLSRLLLIFLSLLWMKNLIRVSSMHSIQNCFGNLYENTKMF